jgi:hypothetical protein
MRMDIRSRVTWLGQFFQIGRIFADWANFCRLGEFSPYWAIVDCRFWTFFWKVTEVTKIIGPLFPPYKFCIYFYRKWVWPHFRRLFGKLIRPPCSGVVAGIYTIIYKDGIFSYIWVWQGWDTILIKTLPSSKRHFPSLSLSNLFFSPNLVTLILVPICLYAFDYWYDRNLVLTITWNLYGILPSDPS